MAHLRDFEPILPDPQPYVEKALALYEKAVREKRGRVVFIVAELGGGKTEHLNALAKAFHHAQPEPNLIAGFFRGGEYNHYTMAWQKNICLEKAITTAGGMTSLLGLFPIPYAFAASFIGQLSAASVSAYEFAEEFKKKPSHRKESADWWKNLLRRAAEEKPLVCLLDDWDEAQRFYWDSMLLSFSREIAQDLPLLLFITIKEPINFGAPEKEETALLEVIKSLTEKGLAEWWPLKKLSRDQVAEAIGAAAPGIASKLHGVTGGNARWVRELWREWRLNETVMMDETDRWVWGKLHKPTMNLYEDILEDRLTRLLKAKTAIGMEEAREVLACASLEGMRFTADAVALTLNWDRDELINFLDDVLVQGEDNPDGLLLEDGSVEIPMPNGTINTLWRYQFVSDLHWMAIEHYGFANEQRPEKSDSEKHEKSEALAKALIETYAPEERLAAAQIARLLRDTGHKEAAQHYQRIADYVAEREVMREQALYLLPINKDDWEQWQCVRTARFLTEAGSAMLHTFPYHETLAVVEEACELARRAKYRDDEAHAHRLCGSILYSEGEYKLARERANTSLDIFRLIKSKSGTAISLELLAQIDFAEGNYAEAREQAAQSLRINQEIGNRDGVASILFLLAQIDFVERNYAEAREQAVQSLRINEEIGNRIDAATSLFLLAQIDRALGQIFRDERYYVRAREQAIQSLKIHQEMGNQYGTASILTLLSYINFSQRNYAEAREQATQSLRINQEIGNQYGVAVSLHSLAEIARMLELPHESFYLLTLSTLILSQIGHAPITKSALEQLYAEQKYTEVEKQELSQKVLGAYQKDGGKELIEKALTSLRKACS